MISHKQLSLADFFTDCQNKFDNDKYEFLELLSQTIDLDEIVPVSFISHFHAATGRPRKHQLYPLLWAFLLQRLFSIPTDSLLIVFLKFSRELRDFCGFDVVPDASKFTRFKQDFLWDLQSMFDRLVDSKALLPVFMDFFKKHPLINPKVFLGDAAFDSLKSTNTFCRMYLLKKRLSL